MWHDEPENPLNERGYSTCSVCGKEQFISELEDCMECNNWVCRSCASFGVNGLTAIFVRVAKVNEIIKQGF